MEIVPKKITKTSSGWKFSFLITLTPKELFKYNSKIEKQGIELKGYHLSHENDQLIIEREIKIMEPWEDEIPEALVESLKIEIKLLFGRLI